MTYDMHLNLDTNETEHICGRVQLNTDEEHSSPNDIIWFGKAILYSVDDDGVQGEVLSTLHFTRISSFDSKSALLLTADRVSDDLVNMVDNSPLDEDGDYVMGGDSQAYTSSWVGLTSLVTNERYRNQGYAKKLMNEYALPFISEGTTSTLIVGLASPILYPKGSDEKKADKARLQGFWAKGMGFYVDEKTSRFHWHTAFKRGSVL